MSAVGARAALGRGHTRRARSVESRSWRAEPTRRRLRRNLALILAGHGQLELLVALADSDPAPEVRARRDGARRAARGRRQLPATSDQVTRRTTRRGPPRRPRHHLRGHPAGADIAAAPVRIATRHRYERSVRSSATARRSLASLEKCPSRRPLTLDAVGPRGPHPRVRRSSRTASLRACLIDPCPHHRTLGLDQRTARSAPSPTAPARHSTSRSPRCCARRCASPPTRGS